MFDDLRLLPIGEVSPVRVRAVADLYTDEDGVSRVHIKAGTEGTLKYRTGAGFIVAFDDGNVRQVFDFQGTMPVKLYRAEDEIALI